jgi:hypothetical protein
MTAEEALREIEKLKLTDDPHEARRLAEFVEALQWDMQQLSFALANNSLARANTLLLDAGLIEQRWRGFMAQGIARHPAFVDAFISVAEEHNHDH